jgi:hypothetical protein
VARFARLREVQNAVSHCQKVAWRTDADFIWGDRHALFSVPDPHAGMPGQQLGHLAFVIRIEVLHQQKGHAGFVWQGIEQASHCIQPSGRGPDRDNRERRRRTSAARRC